MHPSHHTSPRNEGTVAKVLGKTQQRIWRRKPGAESRRQRGDPEAENDTFAKTRRIYKIVIIALIVVLLFCFWLKYGDMRRLRPTRRKWATLCAIVLFFAFLFVL
jgi:hypothetical protein